MNILAHERLQELLIYDEHTGVFTNKFTRNSRCKKGTTVGSKNSRGYLQVSIDRKFYVLHRLAWLYIHGNMPSDQIDHINGNKEDNRIENLRDVTNAENSRNLHKPTGNNLVIGVEQTSNGNYKATISVEGKRITLGTFKEMRFAIKARLDAERKHGYTTNVLSGGLGRT